MYIPKMLQMMLDLSFSKICQRILESSEIDERKTSLMSDKMTKTDILPAFQTMLITSLLLMKSLNKTKTPVF